MNVWPDLAQRLNVSRFMAWKLVRSGEVGSLRIGDRRLVPASWVEAYLAQQAAVVINAPVAVKVPCPQCGRCCTPSGLRVHWGRMHR